MLTAASPTSPRSTNTRHFHRGATPGFMTGDQDLTLTSSYSEENRSVILAVVSSTNTTTSQVASPWWHYSIAPTTTTPPYHHDDMIIKSQSDIQKEVENFFVFCHIEKVRFWMPVSDQAEGEEDLLTAVVASDTDRLDDDETHPSKVHPFSYPVVTCGSTASRDTVHSLSHCRLFGGTVEILVLPWNAETRAQLRLSPSSHPASSSASRLHPSPVAVFLAKGIHVWHSIDKRLGIMDKALSLVNTVDQSTGLLEKAHLLSWWLDVPKKVEQSVSFLKGAAKPLLDTSLGGLVKDKAVQARDLVVEIAQETQALLVEQHLK